MLTGMNPQVFIFFISLCSVVISTPWGRNTGCSTSCTCREEHFSDLAIARYTKHDPHYLDSLTMDYHVSNDVFYDDELKFDEENPLLRVATCIIQLETNLEDFISTIPKSIQALSLVKSTNSGNKTFKMSYLEHFNELIVLEIQGSDQITDNSVENDLTVEIDTSIISLKYLNFDMVHMKNSILQELELHYEDTEDVEIKFEAVTMIQKKETNEILPYYKYKQIQKNLESPILIEFTNLILVRIHFCNLQNIHWEMFDGLKNLKYLNLENNNLKFIPNFAFYGTPNLKSLSLARNNLLSIQITDLAGLLELEYLDLSHNNFSQLSELSFPPFPKLKVADFRDNPIAIVFPNTFDIMNTTDSIILGSEEIRLQLLANSFLGLNQLVKFTINNVDVPILQQDLLSGMPILKELILTGNINKIEYDAFIEVRQLEKLILNNCNIYNISMDSFYGLDKLQVLDLSKNHLKYLPSNIFDDQSELRELLLNENEFRELPSNIFDKIPAKLIRLTQNPWHCSCAMEYWDPMVINKIKQKIITPCDSQHDKGIGCTYDKKYGYAYENKMAPRCMSPNKVKNLSVFQAIRRYLQCKDHKLKLKKNVKQIADDPIEKYKIQNIKPIKEHKNAITEFENLKDLKNVKINHEPNDLKNLKLNNFDSNKQNNFEPLNKQLFSKIELENLKKIKIQENINYDLIKSYSATSGFYFHDQMLENDNVNPNKKVTKKKLTMHKLAKLRKIKEGQNFDSVILHKEM